MIQQQLTLIVGAGASAEFKMPVGSELTKNISGLTKNLGQSQDYDKVFSRKIGAAFGQESGTYFAAGRLISAGVRISRSIDDFLDNHRDDAKVVKVGKMAIAHAILQSEGGSSLIGLTFSDAEQLDQAFDQHINTWAWELLSWLVTARAKPQRMQVFENIRIINFNYDRCLELFLWVGLQRHYGIDGSDAAEIMKTLEMRHPYGRVGALPWENHPSELTVNFGEHPDNVPIHLVAENIKTFTERNHTEKEKSRWTRYITTSRKICFLGFGYHKQNIDLITPDWQEQLYRPVVYGTTLGLSAQAVAVHRQALSDAIYSNASVRPANLEPCTSAKMLSDWAMLLFN